MGKSIPDGEGVIPPPGYIRCFIQNENRYEWVDPANINTDRPTVSILTPAQVERVKAFKEILAEHHTMTLDETLAGFTRDRHPEEEITIWERIANAYEAEVSRRPNARSKERKLIYVSPV
mgnify:CR=1 FL=1